MDIIGVYIGVYIADIIITATITIIVACITAIIGIGETYRVLVPRRWQGRSTRLRPFPFRQIARVGRERHRLLRAMSHCCFAVS
jgi:hypothetical protein